MKDQKFSLGHVINGKKSKINNTHDLSILFSWFKNVIDKKIKNLLINYNKNSPDIKNMGEDDIKNDLSKIETLVYYFYRNEMLNKKFRGPDKFNDVFRFAKSKNGSISKIDWENEIGNFEKGDIQIIQEKIERLHDILNEWGYICATI